MTSQSASKPADRELVLTHLVNAPRELVWKVWTDQKHIEQWWGPNGFTTTTHEIDVKPGGVWRFIMHGPDGTDYPNKIIFTEITEPELIAYKHSDDDLGDEAINFETRVSFEAQGEKTLVTLHSIFPTAEGLKRVVEEHGAIEGGKQHLARLDAYVASVQKGI